MNYQGYIEQVMKLPFINDEQAADAGIKAVLGTLASRLNEQEARWLSETLPPELNVWVLRGHQRNPVQVSADQFVSSIAQQFHLDWGDAKQLVGRVLHCVKESREGAEKMRGIREFLPPDWGEVVERA